MRCRPWVLIKDGSLGHRDSSLSWDRRRTEVSVRRRIGRVALKFYPKGMDRPRRIPDPIPTRHERSIADVADKGRKEITERRVLRSRAVGAEVRSRTCRADRGRWGHMHRANRERLRKVACLRGRLLHSWPKSGLTLNTLIRDHQTGTGCLGKVVADVERVSHDAKKEWTASKNAA